MPERKQRTAFLLQDFATGSHEHATLYSAPNAAMMLHVTGAMSLLLECTGLVLPLQRLVVEYARGMYTVQQRN